MCLQVGNIDWVSFDFPPRISAAFKHHEVSVVGYFSSDWPNLLGIEKFCRWPLLVLSGLVLRGSRPEGSSGPSIVNPAEHQAFIVPNFPNFPHQGTWIGKRSLRCLPIVFFIRHYFLLLRISFFSFFFFFYFWSKSPVLFLELCSFWPKPGFFAPKLDHLLSF